MSARCNAFRAELERALAGLGERLVALAQDPHAHECATCRAELHRERALEALLGSIPIPEAPPDLARRTLARLGREREAARGQSTFDGAIRAELGADALDELLERVPAPRAPLGLAARILLGLTPARGRRSARQRWSLVAVAAGILALILWASSRRGAAPQAPALVQDEDALVEDAELLAYAVEHWELLQDEDLDLWLASLDPLDELLLELTGVELRGGDATHAPAEGESGEEDG